MPKDRNSPEQPADSWKHECSVCEHALVYWREVFESRPDGRKNQTVAVGEGKRMAVDLPIGKGRVRELGLRQIIEAHWKGFSQALDLMDHLGMTFAEERRALAAEIWKRAAIAKLERVEREPYPKTTAGRFAHFVDMARLNELRGKAEFTPSLYDMLAEEVFEGKIPAWVKAVSRGWKAAVAKNPAGVSRATRAFTHEVGGLVEDVEDRRSV